MKIIQRYEFEPGEMVVEVGPDYFQVLAQPEGLKGLIHDGEMRIFSSAGTQFKEPDAIFLRGTYREYDNDKAPFNPKYRETIIKTLKDFGAEIVESKADQYVWLNVFKHRDGTHYYGGVWDTRSSADLVAKGTNRVGCVKVKLEERWDD